MSIPIAGSRQDLADATCPVVWEPVQIPAIRQRLSPDSRDLYAETHRELDRLLLPRVLEYTSGNQRRAARHLGIARQTLHAKLNELGSQSHPLPGADKG